MGLEPITDHLQSGCSTELSYVGALEILLPGARHYTKSGGWGQGFCDEQDQSSAVTKGRRSVRAGQFGSPQNPAPARPGTRLRSRLSRRSMTPLFRALAYA